MPAAATDATWGSCRFCGVAVAPGAGSCGICGAEGPVAAGALAAAPRRVRRWVRSTELFRSVLVIGVVVALGYTIGSAVLSGPPSVADPLSTAGEHAIPVGATWVLAGEVTGGDFVVGNYSTVDPVGLSLGIAVYNSSDWAAYTAGGTPTPAWSSAPAPSGRIVFSAPYTDTFYFVFANPYPAGSGLNVTAYIVTQYESNVGADGFAA